MSIMIKPTQHSKLAIKNYTLTEKTLKRVITCLLPCASLTDQHEYVSMTWVSWAFAHSLVAILMLLCYAATRASHSAQCYVTVVSLWNISALSDQSWNQTRLCLLYRDKMIMPGHCFREHTTYTKGWIKSPCGVGFDRGCWDDRLLAGVTHIADDKTHHTSNKAQTLCLSSLDCNATLQLLKESQSSMLHCQ